jgi:diguanylate cyclase (GGDEF)-like protein/PAS domain S-box-containing protein
LIFENSLDAILLTSPDGKIHRANDSACKMFDMSEDEILELGRNGLVDSTDERVEKALIYREQYGYVKAELTFLRRNQIPFPVMVTSSVFKDKGNNLWTVMIIRDLTETKEIEKNLINAKAENEFLATHDYLTGVLNRRGFIKEVSDFIENDRNGDSSGLLLIDIDYFKDINDKHGHIKGDLILKDFANFLTDIIDEGTLLGRYGGDEFIIFYPSIDEDNIKSKAEDIRSKVEKTDFLHENKDMNLTISIGVTLFPASDNRKIDDLISIADSNMYRAKSSKNAVYFETAKSIY